MALRKGFTRYAFSIQYHGSSFLGFPYLGKDHENTILPDGTDLRGYYSIEGRIRQALEGMIGGGSDDGNNAYYENIKVSSRTDRGVHALKNTCHVDIANTNKKDGSESSSSSSSSWCPNVLRKGLNYYLSRQGSDEALLLKQQQQQQQHLNKSSASSSSSFQRTTTREQQQLLLREQRYLYRRSKRKIDNWSFHHPMNEVRILKMVRAPPRMENKFYVDYPDQPQYIDWNVRYSATQRTYIYRILVCTTTTTDDSSWWGFPFEWDRSWRIFPLKNKKPKQNNGDYCTASKTTTDDNQQQQQQQQRNDHTSTSADQQVVLDIDAMRQAATHFIGTHDFSSFRSAGCSRSSPIVTMKEIVIHSQPYGERFLWGGGGGGGGGGLLGLGGESASAQAVAGPQLVTIQIVGTSFVYHQVRNMVGALVAVGRGSVSSPDDIRDILEAKNRKLAPAMAPAHGLFLVDVQHDGIVL